MSIIQEVAAECARSVMLYSIGKDSAIILHPGAQGLLSLPAAVSVVAGQGCVLEIFP